MGAVDKFASRFARSLSPRGRGALTLGPSACERPRKAAVSLLAVRCDTPLRKEISLVLRIEKQSARKYKSCRHPSLQGRGRFLFLLSISNSAGALLSILIRFPSGEVNSMESAWSMRRSGANRLSLIANRPVRDPRRAICDLLLPFPYKVSPTMGCPILARCTRI